MDIITMLIATLIIGALLSFFIITPRFLKSDHNKKEVPSSNGMTKLRFPYTPRGQTVDVTSYVEEHPGGDAILAHAGDDSTEGFYGPQHATRVFDMIDDFYIGDLEK